MSQCYGVEFRGVVEVGAKGPARKAKPYVVYLRTVPTPREVSGKSKAEWRESLETHAKWLLNKSEGEKGRLKPTREEHAQWRLRAKTLFDEDPALSERSAARLLSKQFGRPSETIRKRISGLRPPSG